MKQSILAQAVTIARSKLKKHPEFLNHPHYTFIVQKNTIVEWATNIKAEPPVHWGYHVKDRGLDYKPKFHAEALAYKKARGLIGNDRFEIINIKLTRTAMIRTSAPCKPCYDLMIALGCSCFWYSSPVGFMKLKV